jgi:hypothetical protein
VNRTSLSLLDRLKVARPDASDWSRLQGVYFPLIERWLGRVPGLGDESADLAQEVLVVVFRELPQPPAASKRGTQRLLSDKSHGPKTNKCAALAAYFNE